MPTTTDLLLEWDRRKPRSRQKELGMSELGACRRRVGYKLAGIEATNPSGSVQAAMGSAIHQVIGEILEDLGLDGVLHEKEVNAFGLKGHFDRVEDGVLIDVKTVSQRWLDHILLHGPETKHLWQINMYAAAVRLAGHKVNRVRIDYLARDTGEEYNWPSEKGAPFNPRHVRDALEWLEAVRSADVEMLPRDEDPDGSFCGHCPYLTLCWQGRVPNRDARSVLYVEDPDAQKWADKLWDLRQQIKALTEQEITAKKALDALRPDDGGIVQAGDRFIQFRRNARNPETFGLFFVAAPKKRGA